MNEIRVEIKSPMYNFEIKPIGEVRVCGPLDGKYSNISNVTRADLELIIKLANEALHAIDQIEAIRAKKAADLNKRS